MIMYWSCVLCACVVTSLLCDSASSMGWLEFATRATIAILMLCGVTYLAVQRDMSTDFTTGVPISKALCAVYIGLFTSGLYLLEADPLSMDTFQFLAYPVTTLMWCVSMFVRQTLDMLSLWQVIVKVLVGWSAGSTLMVLFCHDPSDKSGWHSLDVSTWNILVIWDHSPPFYGFEHKQQSHINLIILDFLKGNPENVPNAPKGEPPAVDFIDSANPGLWNCFIPIETPNVLIDNTIDIPLWLIICCL